MRGQAVKDLQLMFDPFFDSYNVFCGSSRLVQESFVVNLAGFQRRKAVEYHPFRQNRSLPACVFLLLDQEHACSFDDGRFIYLF